MSRRLVGVIGCASVLSLLAGLAAPAVAAARPPVVSKLTAPSGPIAGGTRVAITGTGFAHVKAVDFGATAGRSLTVASASRLVVTSPKSAAGVVNVRVKTTAGTSKVVKADRFTFVAPPAIKAVSPGSGTTAGGRMVTVTGSGFSGIRSVTFGGIAGTRLKVASAAKLTVTSPKHAAGRVSIRVAGTYGTSASTSRDYYSFVTPVPADPWTASPMPYTNGFGAHSGVSISGVSCPAAGSCIAVGSAIGDSTNPLVETFARGAWTGQVLPDVGTDKNGYLSAVSCVSITACVAVGRGVPADTIVETLSGTTWTGSKLPALPGGASAAINSIWCSSTTECVAAGTSSGAADSTPLIESLSGSAWTATTPPIVSGLPEGFLSGISCTTASACVAVGSADGPGHPGTPMVETWNGSKWTPSAPPVADGAFSGSLTAVSCPAVGSCVAVGSDDASDETALVEQQTGGTWTASKPPLVAGHSSAQLVSVSCATASACTAVGGDTTPSGTSTKDLPLTESLSGGAWTAHNPPVPQNSDGFLKAVWCTGATSCTAVGNRDIDEAGGVIFSDTRA